MAVFIGTVFCDKDSETKKKYTQRRTPYRYANYTFLYCNTVATTIIQCIAQKYVKKLVIYYVTKLKNDMTLYHNILDEKFESDARSVMLWVMT